MLGAVPGPGPAPGGPRGAEASPCERRPVCLLRPRPAAPGRGMEAAHSIPVLDVLRRFGVSESCGLSPEQVRRNRDKYGPNGQCGSAVPCGLRVGWGSANGTPASRLGPGPISGSGCGAGASPPGPGSGAGASPPGWGCGRAPESSGVLPWVPPEHPPGPRRIGGDVPRDTCWLGQYLLALIKG